MIAKGIDKLFGDQRLSYRRLTAWIVGCAALGTGLIDAESWTTLTLVYIGADSAVKIASAWKGGNG